MNIGPDVERYILTFASVSDIVSSDEWFNKYAWPRLVRMMQEQADSPLRVHTQTDLSHLFAMHLNHIQQEVACIHVAPQVQVNVCAEKLARHLAHHLVWRETLDEVSDNEDEDDDVDDDECDVYTWLGSSEKEYQKKQQINRLAYTRYDANLRLQTIWHKALITCMGFAEGLTRGGLYWWVSHRKSLTITSL
jgi:hypothetical protein